MASAGVRITGLKPTLRSLKKFGTSIEDAKGAFDDIARIGITLARARTPVRTGRLVETTRGQADSHRARVIQGGFRAAYASYVNYGTRKRRGTRHMNSIDPQWSAAAIDRLQNLVADSAVKNGLS